MMKILYLTPFLPYPLNRGTHQRVYHLLKSLASAHQVTLFSLDPDNQAAAHQGVFEALCARVIRRPVKLNPWRNLSQRLFSPQPETMFHWDLPAIRQELGKILREEHFDLIFAEDICMTQYIYDLLPAGAKQIPVITDRNRVDLEFMQESWPYLKGLKSRANFAENYLKLERHERRLIKRFPTQVVCSPEDAEFLKTQFGVSPWIIGNGVDHHYFQPQSWSRDGDVPVLCFTGAMDYAPNAEGITWFMQEVHPLLVKKIGKFKLRIVGLNPGPEIQAFEAVAGVEVTGGVPDIRPAYAACDVYIAPIRIGGGTRLKIIEAMAMGKPVVSTPTGAQGLGLTEGLQVRYAEKPEAFAAQIADLLAHHTVREKMAQAGMKHILKNFTWESLGQKLVQRIEALTLAQVA
jgi:sugar transferase (PEP-CTERM/EpsH1 system associated)